MGRIGRLGRAEDGDDRLRDEARLVRGVVANDSKRTGLFRAHGLRVVDLGDELQGRRERPAHAQRAPAPPNRTQPVRCREELADELRLRGVGAVLRFQLRAREVLQVPGERPPECDRTFRRERAALARAQPQRNINLC